MNVPSVGMSAMTTLRIEFARLVLEQVIETQFLKRSCILTPSQHFPGQN